VQIFATWQRLVRRQVGAHTLAACCWLLAAGCVQVRLLRNAARFGGAVDLSSTSTLTFKGRNNVAGNNTSTSNGGAFYVDPGNKLRIEGSICASGNQARGNQATPGQGGFARVFGQLVFVEGSEVYLSKHTPNTISIFGNVGAVRCGEGATSWAKDTINDKAYFITGAACACNETFVAGDNVTCVSEFPNCDSSSTWDQGTCACVSVLHSQADPSLRASCMCVAACQ
jgi:hypothetical protein